MKRHLNSERMPGTTSERSVRESKDYLIVLRDEESGQLTASGRHELYLEGVGRTAAFQQQLRAFLKANGLEAEVDSIAPPGVFPVVAIRSTPKVAEAIKSLPDVADVVPDFEVERTGSLAVSTRGHKDTLVEHVDEGT